MEFRVDFVLAIISIVAGVVTIIWFTRDVRRENSKILKAILDTQKAILDTQKAILDTQKASVEIQKASVDVLCKIEEGQRKGFEVLAQMLLNQTKILERINSKLP